MKIGLIDVDGHNFPNLALMKISAWHKNKGDNVEWNNSFKHYDKVYMSKVFTFTPDHQVCVNADQIIKGGTGYNIKSELPEEIENIYPDYNLYNIKNTAYGFLTRGCPRNCKFCIVGEKEGLKSYKVSDLNNFWNGEKYIELLDPNILAYKNHLELLDQLINSKATITINQGMDCRFLNEENIYKINQLKIKMLHFAWDKQQDEKIILEKLKLFNEYTKLDARRKRVYVLCNFDTTFEYDNYRVETLKKLNYDPYIMIYNKQTASGDIKKLARYVNNKFIFWKDITKTFEDYEPNKKSLVLENQISMF